MNSVFFCFDFSLWYYTTAIRNILSLWMNAMWFVTHFFSIPLLAKTLFAPWKRMTDEYHRTGIEDIIATFIMNVMSRVFGAMVRLCILACGVFSLVCTTCMLFVTLAVWVVLPVVSAYFIVYGVTLFLI